MQLSYKQLQDIMERKKYRFFTGDRNINLIGVRANNTISNNFDDTLYIAIELDGIKQVFKFDDFTTDPGHYYLKQKFLNPAGCAILKPGQYPGIWQIGKHKGKYRALVQTGICTVYRDRNKDNTIDTDTEQTGLYGINMHHAYDTKSSINRYSAGCQVHRSVNSLNFILNLCTASARIYGSSFTYTLLEAEDLAEPKKVKPKLAKRKKKGGAK